VKSWEVEDSRTLLERRWLTLREQRVRLPTGTVIDEFHVIESPDWVAVLALREDGQLVLVRQYRHGAARVGLELPAGVIDEGESPEQAGLRELREETGYAAEELRPLFRVSPEPARGTATAHVYFAPRARRVGDPQLDASEDLAVCTLHPEELLSAIDDGRMFHGVHVGAVLLAHRRGWLPSG